MTKDLINKTTFVEYLASNLMYDNISESEAEMDTQVIPVHTISTRRRSHNTRNVVKVVRRGLKLSAPRGYEEKYTTPNNNGCGYNSGGYQSYAPSTYIRVRDDGTLATLSHDNLAYYLNYSLNTWAGIVPRILT